MIKRLLFRFLLFLVKKHPETIVNAYAIVKTEQKKNFVISAKEAEVKKGKRKYTLLFIETKEGQFKFWIKNGKVVIDKNPNFL